MTQTTEPAHPRADRTGTARSIARELTPEELEQAAGLPCFVHHEDAGGQCGRTATMFVYGILLCEVHGAEARAGALSELYDDAADFLDRLDNPHVPIENEEAARAVKAAIRELDDKRDEAGEGEWELLRRAYPTIPERVCSETPGHDYSEPRPTPMDVYLDSRRLLCGMMRTAYLKGEDWLVETLEIEREAASAQASFAIEDYETRVGPPAA